MQSHINYMNSTNDHENRVSELIDFRYEIYKNSMVVRARFGSPFVIHSLVHGRLHVFSLCCLDTIVTIVSHSNNLLLLLLSTAPGY